MPRNDWAKATQHDHVRHAYGWKIAADQSPLSPADRLGLSTKNRRGKHNRRKAKRRRLALKIATSRLQSKSTMLWFGQYKGQTIEQILRSDPKYLHRLAHSPCSQQSWRMKLLQEYLLNLKIPTEPQIGQAAGSCRQGSGCTSTFVPSKSLPEISARASTIERGRLGMLPALRKTAGTPAHDFKGEGPVPLS